MTSSEKMEITFPLKFTTRVLELSKPWLTSIKGVPSRLAGDDGGVTQHLWKGQQVA